MNRNGKRLKDGAERVMQFIMLLVLIPNKKIVLSCCYSNNSNQYHRGHH